MDTPYDLTVRPACEGVAGIDNQFMFIVGSNGNKRGLGAAVFAFQVPQAILKEQRMMPKLLG